MRIFILILVLTGNAAFGQSKTDLYKQVDSLVKYQLRFDSSTVRHSYADRLSFDTTKPALWHCTISIKHSDYPLILVNRKKVAIEDLNKSTLKMVKSITVLNPNEASALYGSQAQYGVIIIKGSENLLRQINSL